MGASANDLAARYAVMLRQLRNSEERLRGAVMLEPTVEGRIKLFAEHAQAATIAHRHAQVLMLARIVENPNGFELNQLTPGDWIMRKIPLRKVR
ncbi:MAG: hypothetical protein IT566_10070 [Rhodospirillaceae bacterium]|nr:hypothetical protein [Rhodospirillaceae bacterium]